MSELIERIEASSEGSRELDKKLCAIYLGHPVPLGCPIPRYTTSIDAALTLVPAGFDWRVGHYAGHPNAGAVVATPEIEATRCDAATPALALCAAALKAREWV